MIAEETTQGRVPHQQALAWTIASVILFAVQELRSVSVFWGDSLDYWGLADLHMFWRSGDWLATFRGYLWPFMLAVWLIPVLVIVPVQAETRYYLPVYLLAWCTIAFKSSHAELAHNLRANPVLIPGAFLALLAAQYLVTSSAMEQVIFVPA